MVGEYNISGMSVDGETCQWNVSGWRDDGFAAYFSYKDLKSQGKYSGEPLQPWKRVLEDVLVIARNYSQTFVTMWYPHKFAHDDENDEK